MAFGRKKSAPVVVTDSAEGPNWVKVTNLETRDSELVARDDREGVAIAMDTLAGTEES